MFIIKILNVIVIDINRKFLKNIFINVIFFMKIGFKVVDVIGNLIKSKNVINIGIIICIRFIVWFIVL